MLAKSADVFIDSAATVATALGVNPFIIGMVVIGFGTSAPELCVSALAGFSGHSNVSLGNAYGSCSFNIALILGVAAMIRPIVVVSKNALAAALVLAAISVFSCALVGFGNGFSRTDGVLALAVFAVLLPLYCWFDQKMKGEAGKVKGEGRRAKGEWGTGESAFAKVKADKRRTGLAKASVLLLVGLVGLVGFSHILVWGAVDAARALGVSELLIGGSNIFNTLGVVGLAGTISPFKDVSPYILSRDLPTLVLLSLSIGLFGVNFKEWRQPGRIGRWEGALWVIAFAVYLGIMIYQESGMSAR